MESREFLEKDSIGKLLVKFSVPAIIGMIVMSSYNIVDRIFVGNGVGPLAISGVAITFPLLLVLMAFGMLIGIGSTSLVSIRLGEKNIKSAEQILGHAVVLSVLISTFMTVFGLIFMEPMLRVLGADGLVLQYALDFMDIFIIGTVFQGVSFTINNIIRGEGNPKIAMLTMIISSVINIALNPFFIFVLDMGIQGSALASVIAQSISAVWVIMYFFGKKSVLKIRLKNMFLKLSIIKEIVSIGFAAFAMQLVAGVVTFLANKSLAQYGGDLAIAAMGIIYSVFMFIFMPVVGINQGAQPIIGYNFGAKRFDRVRQTLKKAIYVATAVSTAAFFVVFLFNTEIISAFSANDEKLIEIGSHGMRIFLLMLPFVGFQIISSGYFQAVGKAKKAFVLTISRQALIFIPLLLVLPTYFKLDGIWMSGPIADFLSFLLTAFFLFKELAHLKNMHEIHTEQA